MKFKEAVAASPLNGARLGTYVFLPYKWHGVTTYVTSLSGFGEASVDDIEDYETRTDFEPYIKEAN